MDESRISEFAQKLKNGENRKVDCPDCIDAGKPKNDLSLSIKNNGDHAIYKCHRCEIGGRVNYARRDAPRDRPVDKTPPTESENAAGIKWLEEERKVPYEAVKNHIEFGAAYFKQAGKSLPCVEFVYKNENGRKVYSKFRSIEEKYFTSGRSLPGGTDTLYLTEAIDFSKNYLVITEGETDALTLKAFGFNAVSMPTGANIKWLSHNQNLLKKFKFVYIWFDADQKGSGVADKIKNESIEITKNFQYINADRLVAIFPDCKDANDIAKKLSQEDVRPALQRVLKEAFERYSPEYIIRPSSLVSGLVRVRDHTYANRIGINEPCLDDVMSLVPGYAGITTGIPGHGKSTFLSWYSYRLADTYGKRTVFWSPENDPTLLVSDLIGMAAGKIVQGHAGASPMTDTEIQNLAKFADDHFRVVEDSEEGADIDSILNRMLASSIDMGGADLFVIDPFNMIRLPDIKDKLDAIKIVFGKIRRFARDNKCFVMLVAHPRKMEEKERKRAEKEDDASESHAQPDGVQQYKMPGMYSISGSADFGNMADLGITVYREDNRTLLTNWKARRPFLGSLGASASLVYQSGSGRFRVLGRGNTSFYTSEDDGPPF